MYICHTTAELHDRWTSSSPFNGIRSVLSQTAARRRANAGNGE